MKLLWLALLLAAPTSDWRPVLEKSGVSVSVHPCEGSAVDWVRGESVMDATPERVWAVIRDYERYPATMPGTQESRVLKREGSGKVIVLYGVLKSPLSAARDYVTRVLDESRWKDGHGYLEASWVPETEVVVPRHEGYVRILETRGFFHLEPVAPGGGREARTRVTYVAHTEYGGSVPVVLVNQANRQAIVEVLRAIQAQAKSGG